MTHRAYVADAPRIPSVRAPERVTGLSGAARSLAKAMLLQATAQPTHPLAAPRLQNPAWDGQRQAGWGQSLAPDLERPTQMSLQPGISGQMKGEAERLALAPEAQK